MGSTLVVGDWETNSKSFSSIVMSFIKVYIEPEKIRYEITGQTVIKSHFKIQNKFLAYMLCDTLGLVDEEHELQSLKNGLKKHLTSILDDASIPIDYIDKMTLDQFLHIRTQLLIELARAVTWDKKYVEFYWE